MVMQPTSTLRQAQVLSSSISTCCLLNWGGGPSSFPGTSESWWSFTLHQHRQSGWELVCAPDCVFTNARWLLPPTSNPLCLLRHQAAKTASIWWPKRLRKTWKVKESAQSIMGAQQSQTNQFSKSRLPGRITPQCVCGPQAAWVSSDLKLHSETTASWKTGQPCKWGGPWLSSERWNSISQFKCFSQNISKCETHTSQMTKMFF